MHVDRPPWGRGALARGSLGLALCIGLAGSDSTGRAADELTLLPAPRESGSMSLEEALARRRSTRRFASTPLALDAASQLLWAAQGVSDERGFRTAPSAGALFPLEIYLVAGAVSDLVPGLYRYEPRGHRLRRLSGGDLRVKLSQAALQQAWIADAPAIVVIAAKIGRTTPKYGRRGVRYVHMEVGHAGQNVYLQAAALELGTCMVGAFDDRSLAALLQLPDGVAPFALMPVGTRRPREKD